MKTGGLANVIWPSVYAGTPGFFPIPVFITRSAVTGVPGGGNIAGIKSFIVNGRPLNLTAHSCAVSVDEIAVNTLDFYPNPLTNTLTLRSFGQTASFTLYDHTGKQCTPHG